MTAFTFHHVGVVTASLERSSALYEELGYRSSQRFEDPRQKVSIVLMDRDGSPTIELVSPLGPDSPAAGWLRRLRSGPYHTCYEVPELEAGIEWLRARGFTPTSEAAPAVAFGMRRVVFLWSVDAGLVELLEALP